VRDAFLIRRLQDRFARKAEGIEHVVKAKTDEHPMRRRFAILSLLTFDLHREMESRPCARTNRSQYGRNCSPIPSRTKAREASSRGESARPGKMHAKREVRRLRDGMRVLSQRGILRALGGAAGRGDLAMGCWQIA
jgi:hypothetical protein